MAITIPTATDAGLGQRLPEVVAQPVKKVLPDYVSPALAPAPNLDAIDVEGRLPLLKGQVIGQGLMNLGNTGMQIGLMQRAQQQEILKNEAISKASVDIIDLHAGLERQAKDIANDPNLDATASREAMMNAATEARDNFKKRIPQNLQAHFAPDFEKGLMSTGAAFLDKLTEKAKDSMKADTVKIAAMFETQAANGDMSADDAIKNIFIAIDNNPHFTEVEKVTAKKTAVANIYATDITKRDTAGDMQGILADLQKKDEQGNYVKYPLMDSNERANRIFSANNNIIQAANEAKRQKEADFRIWKQEARADLKNLDELLKGGQIVPAEMLLSIGKNVQGTVLEPEFNLIKNRREDMGYIQEQLAKDPLTFGAARLGLTVPTLNFNDPQGLMQAAKVRDAVGAKVQAANNLSYRPALTASEMNALTDTLKKDTEGMGINFIESMMRNTSKEFVSGMAKQLAMQPAPEDKNMATIVRFVATGDTLTAKAVAKGYKLLESKAITMPNEDELSSDFFSRAGTALQAIPDNGKEIYDAYRAAYANAAQVAGVQGKTINDGIAAWAFKQIVGDVVEFNNKKVVLPQGISENAFLNSVKQINEGVVKQIGGVSYLGAGHIDDKTAVEMIQDGQWYLSSPDTYRVLYHGLPLMRGDGQKPLEFNIRNLTR